MYYIRTIQDRIRLPPSSFASEASDAVLRILRERYESRIFKEMGIILSINNAELLGDGIVIPGDGGAYYTVQFEALTFLPVVNEVFPAEIKEILEFGAFASIGPFQGLLHISQIGKDKYFFDKKSRGLNTKTPNRNIKRSDGILVKVSTVSLKYTSSDTKIGLTMRPDGLGKMDWISEKKPAPIKKEKESKEVTK
ncbi:DNA-directed RNA polymerase [Candidatus Micrarchaeota archaeon]|nr:DNA-directed RNA polymerase [Candidatus Micrarchaeota archaeon]